MSADFAFIYLAYQFSVFAKRFQQIVTAEACPEIEMLSYLGYCPAGAAIAEHFSLIIADIWFIANSVDCKILQSPFFRIYQAIA